MARPHRTIRDLRSAEDGLRGAFEEFCCHLFRRAPESPDGAHFRRMRGAGGDGGVEATWTSPDGDVWGLQAKFFDTLDAGKKAKLTESIAQATANYPDLKRYTICLPITLTGRKGAKAGKPKTGQHEIFDQWVHEWQADLESRGRSITIDLWDESDLLRRLAEADTTGGLERYWFDRQVMTPTWFSEHLNDARAQAGARYSPELAVDTPLDDALHAFGRSEVWRTRIRALSARFRDKFNWWRRAASSGLRQESRLPVELSADAENTLATTHSVQEYLDKAEEDPEVLSLDPFREAVRGSIDRLNELEPRLRDALLAIHGPGADTPGFRQFQAEYMAGFPMAPLDHLRDLKGVLEEVAALALEPEGALPASPAMVVRGEAGVGKTHGLLDSAFRRLTDGLHSVVLFGEDAAAAGPWPALISKLGLDGAAGRDDMLDALDAAGETTGYPLVIFIDALNETEPDSGKWQSWLPPMVEQVKRRPFLKLCVSCRETYIRTVLPADRSIPEIEHNGFLGREYEAQLAFFRYYGLGVPAEPLLQDEFANPLFLRLICEALIDRHEQAIPAGRRGIRSTIALLFRAKNDRAARRCNYDPRENRVAEAMGALAAMMAEAGTRSLPYADARAQVDHGPAAHSTSLFAVLEGESLITVIEKRPQALGADAEYSVRFTFERVGDHLLAEHLVADLEDVSEAFAEGGRLHALVTGESVSRSNAGLLEALSILLPESHAVELPDVITADAGVPAMRAFVSGLQWRDPQFISNRTVDLVLEAMNSPEVTHEAIEAVLGLAARPAHPLNAEFLDGLLRSIPMLKRDPTWAFSLEQSYSGWTDQVRPASRVHRLIDTARRAELHDLPDEVGVLWATVLAWFCASPDRRIRDRATMAMASILRARPAIVPTLLHRFVLHEDEYVAERVLVASYGALLLSESRSDLRSAAATLYDLYFADGAPPLNASLRDHARLIIELAIELGVPPEGVGPALYRPPYESDWPITLPSQEDVAAYADDRERFPQMELETPMGLAIGTDFARYIVDPRVTSAFDIESAGLDRPGILRWFLKEAVEFGYPGPDDRCALFDRHVLGKFGGGRGRPGWAERLGKKYYWIFLRRLVGQVADHADAKTWSDTQPPSDELQALDLRDIDPTDMRQFLDPPSEATDWLEPAPYVFRGRDTPEGDAAWVKSDEFTDVSQALVVIDNNATTWQVLDMATSWQGIREDPRIESRRHIQRSVRAAACPVGDVQKVKEAFATAGLDHFNRQPRDYRGYLGEYPRRWPYANHRSDPLDFETEDQGILFQNMVIRQLRGSEWEYDYSQAGRSKSLLMPSVDLVLFGDLKWDHRGGWHDANGVVQIKDPWWWAEGRTEALIVRQDYVDRYLEERQLALVLLGFQTKFVTGMDRGPGVLDERTLHIRHGGNTEFIERNVS